MKPLTSLFTTLVLILYGYTAHAAAPRWEINPELSTITFEATQNNEAFQGKFSKFDITLLFDPEAPETSHIEVQIYTGSATAGTRERDSAMPNHEWFDSAGFPKAVFESKAVTRTGDNTYAIDGMLTLKGVKKPIRIPMTLTEEKDGWTRATGEFMLNRKDYEIGTGQWSSDQWIKHEVKVGYNVLGRPVK